MASAAVANIRRGGDNVAGRRDDDDRADQTARGAQRLEFVEWCNAANVPPLLFRLDLFVCMAIQACRSRALSVIERYLKGTRLDFRLRHLAIRPHALRRRRFRPADSVRPWHPDLFIRISSSDQGADLLLRERQ